MKKLLRSLLLLLVLIVLAAAFALWKGWLRLPVPLLTPPTPPVAPLPPPSSGAPASPPPVTMSTPSPLPTRDPRVLRVAVNERASALLFLALPQFIRTHENDLDVEVIVVPEAALRWQMLSAGRVDLACGTLDSFVLAAKRNDPGALLFEIAASKGLDALVARNAASLRDLKGKAIAVVGGEGGLRLLAYFLDSANMLLSHVRVVDADDVRDAVQLLRGERVDAAVLWSPYADAATKEMDVHVIARSSDTLPQPIDVCVVSHTALANRKSQVLKLMRSWFELERTVISNRLTGIELVSRYSGHPATEVADLLASVRLFTLDENQRIDTGTVGTEVGALQDFWRITDMPNNDGKVDAEHLVQLDLTRQIEPASASPRVNTSGHPEGHTPSAKFEEMPIEVDSTVPPSETSSSSASPDLEQKVTPDAPSDSSPSPH